MSDDALRFGQDYTLGDVIRPESMPVPIEGGEWRKIGEVDVDSASMAVVDPIMGLDSGPSFMAGLGDGGYEVWGREVEIEPGDKRWVEIRVALVTESGLDEWWAL